MTHSPGNSQSFPLLPVLLALVGAASNVCMVTNRPAPRSIPKSTMRQYRLVRCGHTRTAELTAGTNASTMPSVDIGVH